MKQIITIALLLLFFAGCGSGPVRIPDGASAAELTQMAQTAMDRDRYNQAIQYYEAITGRFSYDSEAVCSAEYGIALVHYKQKKYELAKEEFSVIIAKYAASGGGSLPKKYQILSSIVLERINKLEHAKPEK